jgi:O-antigen/teichoic acid export membrane protein
MTLGEKALGGFFWTLTSNIGLKSVTLIVNIVLARLLVPEDFGLVAMLMIFFAVSQSFVESGFSQALIREKELTEKDKATTFYLNVIIAVVCYLLLWIAAPKIASFYNNEKLIALTRFMGLSIVFQSFYIVQQATLTHALNFKKITIVSLTASVLSSVIAVVMAYQNLGVWALAVKYVSFSLIAAILFYVVNPWYPRASFSRQSYHRLFGFGSKLLLSGLLDTFYQNIYNLIIGKYYSAATLGYYAQAKMYVDQATQTSTSTLQTVTYPILSQTKDDLERLRSSHKRIIMASSYIIFPMTIGLAVLAEPLIMTFVGEKWKGAIPLVQILCVSEILYHLHAINLNLLKVMGRSDLFLKLEVIKKINTTIAILIGIKFGLWGLLIGSVVNSYVALFINMYYTHRLVQYSYREQIADLLPVVLHTLPMLLLLYLFVNYITLPHMVMLIIGLLLGVISYFGFTYVIKSRALVYIMELLSHKVRFLKRVKLNS